MNITLNYYGPLPSTYVRCHATTSPSVDKSSSCLFSVLTDRPKPKSRGSSSLPLWSACCHYLRYWTLTRRESIRGSFSAAGASRLTSSLCRRALSGGWALRQFAERPGPLSASTTQGMDVEVPIVEADSSPSYPWFTAKTSCLHLYLTCPWLPLDWNSTIIFVYVSPSIVCIFRASVSTTDVIASASYSSTPHFAPFQLPRPACHA